jgi:hypothetical protein
MTYQQLINKFKQLHNSLIKTEILMPLQKKVILLLITPIDTHFPRMLLGSKDL